MENYRLLRKDIDVSKIGFKSIQLLKNQTLGIGSYGKVCKARCDDLICAAKIMHETLFDPTVQQQIVRHREHRLPFRRFQQECEFMSAIRHPNIVQYLGTHQDPETGLPILLMELMDDSLTHFLEKSLNPVSYHNQAKICHDITMAISYLHSNGIVHRDLSSNNVLLHGNLIAKVTDFGMAKLGSANPQATRISLTMVPGTDAYMPPEAMKDRPIYTEKIDCFAIGVLIIQILTRQFPKPGDRHKKVHTADPKFPTIEVPVSESERRQNHINQVEPNHPLLAIALHCLQDNDIERPSAQELCHRVADLKRAPQYAESVSNAQERRSTRPNKGNETERVIIIGSQQEYQHLRETIRDRDQQIEEKESQIQHLTQQLEASQQVTAQLQKQTQELEQKQSEQKRRSLPELPAPNLPPENPPVVPPRRRHRPHPEAPQPSRRVLHQTHHSNTRTTVVASRDMSGDKIKMKWREARKAAHKTSRGPDAVVRGDKVFFKAYNTRAIFMYNATHDTCERLPDCPNKACSLAIVDNLLTTIGGKLHDKKTNQLFSYTEEDKTWKQFFQSMLTKRYNTTALCSGQLALIVAGGRGENDTVLRTVEVMDITTQQWSTAADLPEPLSYASATICGDRIYILSGWSDSGPTRSVYTCLASKLFLSCRSRSFWSIVWTKVADLPVYRSTCVTLHGQLVAIGGCDSKDTPTSDVRLYHSISNTWDVISKMNTSRHLCIAAVLPDNEVMVVGGRTSGITTSEIDSVEVAKTSF